MQPSPSSDEDKMRKLGARIRSGFAQQYPFSGQSRQTIRDAVRDQHARDQEAQPPPKQQTPKTKSRGMER